MRIYANGCLRDCGPNEILNSSFREVKDLRTFHKPKENSPFRRSKDQEPKKISWLFRWRSTKLKLSGDYNVSIDFTEQDLLELFVLLFTSAPSGFAMDGDMVQDRVIRAFLDVVPRERFLTNLKLSRDELLRLADDAILDMSMRELLARDGDGETAEPT